MASKEYIERLQRVIRDRHGADSEWIGTQQVLEYSQSKKVWEGEVEIFELLNHPNTNRCYAWSDFDPAQENITAVLAMPPVDSPLDAVRAHIVEQASKGKQV